MQLYHILNPIVVSDSGSNIKCAIKLNGWDRFPCTAHTINLAVQDGLNIEGHRSNTETNFVGAIDKCKSVVRHFKHSATATSNVREAAAIIDKQNHGVVGKCQQLIQKVILTHQFRM